MIECTTCIVWCILINVYNLLKIRWLLVVIFINNNIASILLSDWLTRLYNSWLFSTTFCTIFEQCLYLKINRKTKTKKRLKIKYLRLIIFYEKYFNCFLVYFLIFFEKMFKAQRMVEVWSWWIHYYGSNWSFGRFCWWKWSWCK